MIPFEKVTVADDREDARSIGRRPPCPWHTQGVAHPSTKQILKQLIDELPDDATIADVQYRLYIIDAVNRGREEIASGAGIPHERVAAELRAKWGRARAT